MPIEEDIIYIKLAKSPLAIEGTAKHNTEGDGIYHGTESLVKVNARLLVKAFSNKASFISCNRAVEILFDAKHPFVTHYILSRSWGNQSLNCNTLKCTLAVFDIFWVFCKHNLNVS